MPETPGNGPHNARDGIRSSEYPEASYWRGVHVATSDDLGAVCYPDRSRSFNRYIGYFQRRALEGMLARHRVNLRGASVLDVGTGRGRWAAFFRGRGARCTGVDISADALASARREVSGCTFVGGSATKLPFADASFDLVNSITVLMHIPAELQREAVASISRVARPGGYCVLVESTWNDPAPIVFGQSVGAWLHLFAEQGWQPVAVEGHFYHLPFRVLAGLARFNILRPLCDAIAVLAGYPLEWLTWTLNRDRQSKLALQHLFLLRKE